MRQQGDPSTPPLNAVVTYLDKDATLRWSGREGDFVLWMRIESFLAPAGQPPNILDLWQLHDGDFITITNRAIDLPPWFELHPTEVQNALTYQMMAKIEKGYKPPDEIMDGPNLWRLRAGDRVAWVGDSRPDRKDIEGILAILDCHANALLVGETTRPQSVEDIMTYGGPRKDQLTPVEVARGHAAVKAVQAMGCPCVLTEGEWGIG
jgi:hypothetical protein